jgi:hypothetical protein
MKYLWLLTLLAMPVMATDLPFFDNFKLADPKCWSTRLDNGGRENSKGCGDWTNIADVGASGGTTTLLTHSAKCYLDGDSSCVEVKFCCDENQSNAQVNFKANNVYVSAMYFFESDYEFAPNQKLLRLMFDPTKDWKLSGDQIIVMQSSQGNTFSFAIAHNSGLNYYFTVDHPPGGYMPRGVWTAIQLHLKANTLGKNDGVMEMWMNDKLIASRTGLSGTDMRGAGDPSLPFQMLGMGGWNSGGGPTKPVKYLYDNVRVDTVYKAMLVASTIPVPPPVPVPQPVLGPDTAYVFFSDTTKYRVVKYSTIRTIKIPVPTVVSVDTSFYQDTTLVK